MSKAFRPEPEVGDILWCAFPQVESIKPGPENRPALVLAVEDDPSEGEPYRVRVAYGTATFKGLPHRTEFDIDPQQHAAAFKHAGLSWPTRFELGNAVMLPYNVLYFALKPNGKGLAPGPTPRLGSLHASRTKDAYAAWQAVIQKGKKKLP